MSPAPSRVPVHNIPVAEIKAGKSPGILQILALGSCVGVCLYDPTTHIGGVAHVMLPEKKDGLGKTGKRYRFADRAIPALIAKLEKLGARKKNLHAKLVGGAKLDLRRAPKLKIGEQNITSVHDALMRADIEIFAEVVGGKQRTSLIFDLETGDVYVSRGDSVREKI